MLRRQLAIICINAQFTASLASGRLMVARLSTSR